MVYKEILQDVPEEAEHSLAEVRGIEFKCCIPILKINFKQSSSLCEDKVQMLTLAKSPQGFQLDVLHRTNSLQMMTNKLPNGQIHERALNLGQLRGEKET